jgi:D-lactate dehydrogenase
MEELSHLVIERYQGALKAEHGTGRNMAPYVEKEWGIKAYALMKRIKTLFDPEGILNPGVLMNEDHQAHLKNLKTTPAVHAEIDQCIECGFCEIRCPSRNLTLTPRQRIAAMREVTRLEKNPKDNALALSQLKNTLSYQVNETCATDGLCSLSCPVGINTGNFIKHYRADLLLASGLRGKIGISIALFIAKNFSFVLWCTGLGLKLVSFLPIPKWGILKWLPQKAAAIKPIPTNAVEPIIYFPSCIVRTMGPAKADPEQRAVHEAMLSIFSKAHFETKMPENLASLCCGLPFESKGYTAAADLKIKELEKELLKVSDNGRIPIVCETSPCVLRMKNKLDSRLKVFESTEFVHDKLLSRLHFKKTNENLALHITCSSQRMGLDAKIHTIAKAMGNSIIKPVDVGCCGFAGDKGFTHPELNESALASLHDQVKECSAGLSNSRTCEIGLSRVGRIPYQSILYWIDKNT